MRAEIRGDSLARVRCVESGGNLILGAWAALFFFSFVLMRGIIGVAFFCWDLERKVLRLLWCMRDGGKGFESLVHGLNDS